MMPVFSLPILTVSFRPVLGILTFCRCCNPIYWQEPIASHNYDPFKGDLDNIRFSIVV